jgi:hypothetical protein
VRRRLRIPVLGRGWWWLEIVAAVAGYELYDVVQAQTAGDAIPARRHALDVLHAERVLHIDAERWINHLATVHGWIALSCGYFYPVAHPFITGAVLIYLWRRRPASYPRFRTALVVASLAALLVYWLYPVAPPRFAEAGLTDTLTVHDIFGAAHVHKGLVNLYAAMPSLHIAWSLWCAAAIALTGGSRWRQLAWLYPVFMTIVITTTANHFLLDAVAGAALMTVALFLVREPAAVAVGVTRPPLHRHRSRST